ncbi:hypothetical protein HY733_00585 [Candidatus Uhrbacteria bacterium]|nr:hypothetical protein [Candidatus Uhrbacteria bacterium]
MQPERWQQELAQTIRTLEELESYFPLKNKSALTQVLGNMRLAITPHIDGNGDLIGLFLYSKFDEFS